MSGSLTYISQMCLIFRNGVTINEEQICWIVDRIHTVAGNRHLLPAEGRRRHTDKTGKEYQIFYIDSKSYGIVSEAYVPLSLTKEDLVKELLEVLQKEPSNMIYRKGIPDGVTILDYSIANDQLTINFDTKYGELTGIPEVLCRATVVKTLCQIPGINFVLFNVNGQPLIDSNGVQIGLMTAEFFIETPEPRQIIRSPCILPMKPVTCSGKQQEPFYIPEPHPLKSLLSTRL